MFSFINVIADIYKELKDINNNEIGIIEYYVKESDNWFFSTFQYDFIIQMLNCFNEDSKTDYEKFTLDTRNYEVSFWNFPERDDYTFRGIYKFIDKDENILYFNKYVYIFNLIPQENNEVCLFFGKLEYETLSRIMNA